MSDPPKTPLTRDRALQLAQEVHAGKSRSYVAAAIHLAEYILQEQRLRTAAENELAYYKACFFTRLTPDSLRVLPTPGSPTLGKRYKLIDVSAPGSLAELEASLASIRPGSPFTHVPDPFPAPPVSAPPEAVRMPTMPAPPRVPGEHAFDLPTVYRTNRPPELEDLRAMRSPIPEPLTERDVADELVSAPRLTATDRPDPYSEGPESTRKATQPSMRSPIPHPRDSSHTMIFDFSPANTPPLPEPSSGVPVYCGLCEHDHCVCR